MRLPLLCEAEYFKGFLTRNHSDDLYKHLISDFSLSDKNQIETQTGELIELNFGKMTFVDKDIYDKDLMPKSQWGYTAIWSEKMRILKEKIELHTSHKFQVCVCIFYPNGNSGVDFHSDYIAFGDTSYIPSISLGQERKFVLREKRTYKEFEITLANGSLIVMGENCQELYEHSLPVDPSYINGRVNLTFRKFDAHQ